MTTIPFELVTFDGVAVRGDAVSVSVQTPQGEITILPHHIPLITSVVPGELRLILKDTDTPLDRNHLEVLAVGQGFLEVTHHGVTLMTRTAETVDDIDIARAEEAVQRAQTHLAALTKDREATDSREVAETSALIARNVARLSIARRRRMRPQR